MQRKSENNEEIIVTARTRTIKSLQTEISALRKRQNEAHERMDFEAAQDIGVQISALHLQIERLLKQQA